MGNTDTSANPTSDLVNMVISRYGDRLNPEEVEEVRKGVERIEEGAQALRSVKLHNSDEPLSIFKPFRAQED